jgi:aspartate aminotransferase
MTLVSSLSSNIAQLKESATIAVSQRVRALRAEGRTVLDLGAGEPDFDTPEFIRHAAKTAIDRGATHYTAVEGIVPLREAIAARANARYRGSDPVDARDVVVSTGSKQSLFNACFALFGAGDEVLVPTPSWTSYYEMVALARATAVPVLGDVARNLKVDTDDLRGAATDNTRGIILNTPCNPTGSVYDADELRAILELAEERGWWVLCDEIYGRITYEAPAPSSFDVATSRDRLIVIDGVAKAYAMTGWRIGWATAPREIAQAMTALQSHTTSNATTVSQHAALAALNNPAQTDPEIARMVGEFRRRRDAALEILTAAGVPTTRPAGAFYLFIDVRATDTRDDAGRTFTEQLLDQHAVAVVPGSAFYTPGWVRMSYAAPFDSVVHGARCVAELWSERSGK